ncbi:hypothetical protein B0H13DRAFT_1862406 [Mycena leptocephala]|nr:hypothetical protein B0H13DRAFT_1862406 [Mycena leptocephala]
MPFTPVATLDPERLKIAAQTLCDVFGIASLHPHQEETGQNILRPGNTAKECQKITLLVGPLVGLLEDQAKILNEKGVPAAAITSKSKNIEQLLTVSNEKLNVSLVVRISQEEPESFADLITIFPDDFQKPEDFAQYLFYVNGRQEAEKMQDFLRDNIPEGIDPKIFESGDGLSSNHARLFVDAATYLLVSYTKIGRCVRDHSKRGVAVLYITKAMYARCCTELDIMRREDDENSSESDPEEEPEDEEETGAQADLDAAAAAQDRESDDEEAAPAPKRRKLRHHRMSALERRDLRYLLEYIVTEGCRRIPWNKFFGNKDKKRLVFPVPEGPCCDNCEPDKFQVENVVLVGGQNLKTGRKEKSSPELEAAMRWGQATRFGETIVKAIQDVVILFPDHAKVAREREAAERTQRTLDADAAKELRNRLLIVFNGCYDAVFSQRESVPPSTRKTKKPKEPRQICKRFLQLPKSMQHFPDYYVHIKNPISMLCIKAWSQKPTYYQTLHEYRHDWHLLFENARQYNTPGSQIYEDAEFLQKVFDRQLYLLSNLHDIPGCDDLPCKFCYTPLTGYS